MRVSCKLIFSTLLTILTALQSCTLEKRKYTSGFHVDWHNSQGNPKEKLANDSSITERNDLDLICTDLLSVIPPLVISQTKGTGEDYSPMIDKRETDKVIKTEKVKTISLERKSTHFPFSKLQPMGALPLAKFVDDNRTDADIVLSWIAFAFAMLSIAFVILAVIINGWAGLGYIAFALVAGVIAAVMSIIAKLVVHRKQNPTPWFLWFALAVGAIWTIFLLRILFERG